MTTRRPVYLYQRGSAVYSGGGSSLLGQSNQSLGTGDKPREGTIITPTSVQPAESKHCIPMQSEGGRGGQASSSEVATSLQNARTALEELRLEEAEQLFLQTYGLAQEKSADVTCLVHIYTGLAEVCTRRSRGYRQSPLEWLWLCVHGGALLGEAAKVCLSGMDTELENQTRDWLSAQQAFAVGRAQNLQDVVGRTLLNWLREDWRLINPYHAMRGFNSRTPMTPSHYPLTGGHVGQMRPYHTGFMSHGFSLESLHEPPARSLGNHFGQANWFQRIQLYCHRRLHSNDVKAIIQEVLSFEGNASDSDKSDQKLEPETISEETESVTTEPPESVTNEPAEELVEEEEEEEEMRMDTFVIETPIDVSTGAQVGQSTTIVVNMNHTDIGTSNIKTQTGHLHSQRPGAEHSQQNHIHNGNRHEVVEEVTIEEEDQHQEREKEKVLLSPLHENLIKLMIGKIYHKVVNQLIGLESYTQAELLCESILEIVEEVQDGSTDLLRFSAQVLQNMGLLCLKQGLINKGRVHFEKALRLFRDLHDHDAHREVAVVLIDLGNAYVTENLHEDALYAEVIAAICEFFEREAADEQDSGGSSTKSDRPSPTKENTSKNRNSMSNIDAAISCYTEALSVLENNEETQKDIVARALRKLGDCHFVQRSFTEALVFYEKALGLFRLSGTYGKESVLENAHVLIMLGVSTFMLHVYPRAAHVFELGLHMVKHAYGLTLHTFLHGLILSLLGITYYKMKAYHKCVSFCSQAFETFWTVYEEKITELPQQKFWLVCQNLYMLGNTYNILNLQHKAIKFLNIGRLFMRESSVGERRQHMRILQILGDCYFAQYDYKTALTYYNEALDIGDKLSMSQSLSESEMSRSGSGESGAMLSSTEDLDMALHNQLLSRSADAHISMKQYQNAVHYLEQARDIQDVLEEDIKGDLVSTLHQLGQMHTMAGDIDKAIESYRESLEVFREIHNGQLGPEMCITLGNLATICYVKACVCEEIDQELEMILSTEQYFQESLKLEIKQSVCVKYAIFLYSQANYEDAVMYLKDALKANPEEEPDTCIVYGGLEKVTLPEALQDQVEAQEEVLLPAPALAHYLLLLSHKQLGSMRRAEESLLDLLHEIYLVDADSPFLHGLLGLALMEMGVFREAALHFRKASLLDPEYHLALDNYCLCLCLDVFSMLQRALNSIFVYYRIWSDDEDFDRQVAKLMQAADNLF